MLDFTLTPKQRVLQQKARDYALKEVLPVAWIGPMAMIIFSMVPNTGSRTAAWPITFPFSPPSIYEGTSGVQRVISAGYLMGQYQPIMPPLEDMPLHRQADPLSEESMKTAWRCRICGHVHHEDTASDECLYCFFPSSAFKRKEG